MRYGTVLALTLLAGACTVDAGNDPENGLAETNGTVSAPSGASPGDPSTPGQPGNGQQVPEPSGQVTLSAAPATTSADSTMTLTLTNGAREQIGYNLCTSALETSAGRPVPTNRVCTMELRMLEPGRSADYRYELPVNMLAGSYRFVTQVEWMESGRRGTVRSDNFEVR